MKNAKIAAVSGWLRWCRRGIVVGFTAFASSGFGQSPATSTAAEHEDVEVARAVALSPQISALGVVTSSPEIAVTARAEGSISGLHILPGTQVHAGDLLARLAGSARAAALQKAQGDVDLAMANLKLSRDLLEGVDQSPPGLVTAAQRQTAVNQAATAEINFKTAQETRDLLVKQGEIRAPADGVITAIVASDGQQVLPDAVIARLQPAGPAWVLSSFWAEEADALTVGMKGIFTPADGSPPVRVHLDRIVLPQHPDGSTIVMSVADESTSTTKPANGTWRLGESGTLVLMGKSRQVVEVPTASLIMSAGKWWAMVSADGKEQPRQVETGPQDGMNTVILHGITPGESVVVTDAYLHFNRDFARQFQQTD